VGTLNSGLAVVFKSESETSARELVELTLRQGGITSKSTFRCAITKQVATLLIPDLRILRPIHTVTLHGLPNPHPKLAKHPEP
jgi:hypothetical protein